MTTTRRIFKRISVIAIVALFIGLLWAGYYFAFRPVPTCMDGIRNQGERGVDCGGPCHSCPQEYRPEDLVVREISFMPTGEAGIFDVLAKVYNPNDEIGLSSFQYTFTLFDGSGTVVAERSETGFILPQDTKYFLEIGLKTSESVARAEISFSGTGWERFSGYREKPRFTISNRRYETISSGVGFSRVIADVTNDSEYDFAAVSVKCILRDQARQPIAINQTEQRTFRSKEVRESRCSFPTAFSGTVAEGGVEVEVEVDIYHEENILQRTVAPGTIQYR